MKNLVSFHIYESETPLAKNKIIAYHGTNNEFVKFDMIHRGQTDDGFYGSGFYFTPDREYAGEYGNKILKCELTVNNPFYLRTWGTMGGFEELDLRDDLATLNGIPSFFKTNRKLPGGYEIRVRPDAYHSGDVHTAIEVVPKKELYGTDKEIYGDAIYLTKQDAAKKNILDGYIQQAIVEFNDSLAGVEIEGGLANWLMQMIDRDNFHNLLEKNGYDSLIIVRVEGLDAPLTKISEIMMWNPEQIKILSDQK